MIKVLMVVEAGGGVGRHVTDLVQGLTSRGVEVHLIYSGRRMEQVYVEALKKADGAVLVQHAMRRSPHPIDLRDLNVIRRYAKRHGPFSLIHGHSSKGGALGRLAASLRGIPSVYTPNAFRTLDPRLGRAGRWFYGRVEQALAGLVDGLIAVSSQELEHARTMGIPESKLHLVFNAIDPRRGATERYRRDRLGLADDELVLGFVGRLTSQKAPEHLLRCFAAAAAQRPGVRLAMVGDGPQEEELRRLAGDLGIAEQIVWTGVLDGLAAMRLFDVLVLPSRYEGFAYVLLEGLANGLPIVTTEIGGAREAVEDGENGFVVPIGDAPALERALVRLIGDDDLRARMALRSGERVGRFTLESMTDATIGVYDQVVAARSV